MMSSREILEFITENENITLSKLSQLMGLKRAQPLYDIRDGKIKAISTNYVEKILNALPRYNRVWLITGEGNPLSDTTNEMKNKNAITERFVNTYKSMGLTGYRMGKDCPSITKQKISNIENRITEVTAEILADFSSAYEKVNANYILTGKGSMFLNDENNSVDSLKTSDSQKMFEDIIKGREKEISDLKDEIARMKSEIDKLTGQNDIMREQLGIGGRKASSKTA